MIDPLSSDTKVGILFMYPNYFQAFLMKTPSFWWKYLLCWKEGVVWLYKGAFLSWWKDFHLWMEKTPLVFHLIV